MDSNLKTVVTYCAPNHCKKCNTNTIECYTENNKKIYNFTVLVNENIIDNSHELIGLMNDSPSYMMCSKCRTKYNIDWSSNFPKPMVNERKIRKFSE